MSMQHLSLALVSNISNIEPSPRNRLDPTCSTTWQHHSTCPSLGHMPHSIPILPPILTVSPYAHSLPPVGNGQWTMILMGGEVPSTPFCALRHAAWVHLSTWLTPEDPSGYNVVAYCLPERDITNASVCVPFHRPPLFSLDPRHSWQPSRYIRQ